MALRRALAAAGLHFSLSSFAQGTGPAPGVTLFRPRLGGSPLDVMASSARSLQGDSLLELRVGRLPHAPEQAPSRHQSLESLAPAFAAGAGERAFAYVELRRRDLDGGALYDDRGGTTPFRLDDESFDLVAGYRLAPGWLASVRAGTLAASARLDVGREGWLAALEAAASGPSRRYFRTSASLSFDRRDHPRRPTRGRFVELSLAHYAASGPRSGFSRLWLDARQFVALGSPRDVLALHGAATLDGGEAPFYLLDAIGGGERLRGYRAFRFRGPRVVALSAEYRRALSRPLEAALFCDAGKVWGGPVALGSGGVVASCGLGLGVKAGEGGLLRLEAARGAEGTRAQLRLGYAF